MTVSGLVITPMQGTVVVGFRQTSILDAATVDAIAVELYPLIDQQAHRRIVLDFQQVQFLSSSMLGVLINMHRKAQAIKGRIVLCGIRPELMRVFKIMKLEEMLEFADNESEAMSLLFGK